MAKYIVHDIENLEDIKLAKTNSQIDFEESMEYIPGSSIRGAFIHKYIQETGIKDINQGIHRERLLKGGIKFLNAYPLYEDQRSYPLPKAYFATKEDMRESEDMSNPLDMKLGLDRDLPSNYQRIRLAEFIAYNGYTGYTRIKLDKNSNLHINKREDKNTLFRYESIEKGQAFRGIIKVQDDSYIAEVKRLLENNHIYIGGSKGSGYGGCRITRVQVVEENPEYEPFRHRDNFKNYIYLIALSDIIYRNELGQYKTYIDVNYLCKKLGLKKLKYIDSIIEIKNITSFNNKWNCRTPQIVGIKTGSIFKYEILEGQVDKNRLLKFMDEGIGDRKVDGFGRFVIVDSIEEGIVLGFPEKEYTQQEYSELEERLNETEKQQLQDIVNKIYENRVNNDLADAVLAIKNDIRNPEAMNPSQWGNLKDLFSYLSILEPEEGIKTYEEYMLNIKDKAGISLEQLENVKWSGGDIKDLLDDRIKYSTDTGKFHSQIFRRTDKVRIGDIESEIDERFAYRMNLKVLIELTKYQLRALKGEGI
ncbi:RAMP superfamily CRISPR-associated protein [Clostridium sp. Cult1]|uniref:RAMP superfamily CRISPR-associated protein n=1 Tax=Clostridium sp. Cult1 TaxID=2079002 RepID=UPI001F18375B|nr:RAMP superfamily CRISPR-associated protein [Clostridium sp. Cult1]MCF6463752.1 hypothetical protein [Clostridium sp. Cult1]